MFRIPLFVCLFVCLFRLALIARSSVSQVQVQCFVGFERTKVDSPHPDALFRLGLDAQGSISFIRFQDELIPPPTESPGNADVRVSTVLVSRVRV